MDGKAKYLKALKHLEQAQRELADIADWHHQNEVWNGYDDARNFANSVAQIIESDEGECGLKAYVKEWVIGINRLNVYRKNEK